MRVMTQSPTVVWWPSMSSSSGPTTPSVLEGDAGVSVEVGHVVAGGGEHERTVTVEGLVEPLFDHLGPCVRLW